MSDLLFDFVVLFVIFGGLLFFIIFFGCLGVLWENICMLCCYVIIVGVFLLIEVVCGVLGFIFCEKVEENIWKKLNDVINFYCELDKLDL